MLDRGRFEDHRPLGQDRGDGGSDAQRAFVLPLPRATVIGNESSRFCIDGVFKCGVYDAK